MWLAADTIRAMKDCVFCKIVDGIIPAEKVYEDEKVIAFLDLHPVNPGHTLVIPKYHVGEWQEMNQDLLEHVTGVASQLGRTIKTRLSPPRVGLWIEGFEVPHTHVHVCPLENISDLRTKRSAEDMQADPDFEELKKVAAKLRG